ncbi:MAG: glycosyltransferase family 4 protein [bacterium]|nr:glycosyltransferase family 4 protein [bacterium]
MPSNKRVLHILSQRPLYTGSGMTLDALARHAASSGWVQCVVVGAPADDPQPRVAGLDSKQIHPLLFDTLELDFHLPGMSDVMPYPSTRFSAMTEAQLNMYRNSWRPHLQQVISDFQPTIIHAHHIWLVASLLKEIAPEIPVLNHCHATGLRQMQLCPDLAQEVQRKCARNEAFLALHQGLADDITAALKIDAGRIHVVGAGYCEDIFKMDAQTRAEKHSLIYTGKCSAAKGLPWLLDAVETLQERIPDLRLHVAGSGAGSESEELIQRMREMAPIVSYYGQVSQTELAELMRRSTICVLPSFYEGVPLVLVEALACGCRLVASDLPGIREQLRPHLDFALDTIPLPRLERVDAPLKEDLPAFVANLETAIETALAKAPPASRSEDLQNALAPFRWKSLFQRVESLWKELSKKH